MLSRALRLSAIGLVICLPLSGALAQGKVPHVPPQRAPDQLPQGAPNKPDVAPPAREGLSGDWRASKLIGSTMTNTLGESVGRVEDVVIDSDGKVVAVMVGVGGFLGLGETSVAIGLRHLVITQIDAEQLEVKTSLSRRAIEQAAQVGPINDGPLPE